MDQTVFNYITWAETEIENGDYIQAESCYKNALKECKTNEDFAECYISRAGLYVKKNNANQALADLKKAADYGSADALEMLKKLGISYTPQKLSASGSSTTPKPSAPPPVVKPMPAPVSKPAPVVPSIKYNGVYCFNQTHTTAFIRFYEDGTVIILYSKKKAAQIKKTFDKNKEYTAIGKYTTSGNEIKFQVKLKEGISDYNGVIVDGYITLNAQSAVYGNRYSENYFFTAW